MKCYYCGKPIKSNQSIVKIELLKFHDVERKVHSYGYTASVTREAFFHLTCFLRANTKLLILGWKIKG